MGIRVQTSSSCKFHIGTWKREAESVDERWKLPIKGLTTIGNGGTMKQRRRVQIPSDLQTLPYHWEEAKEEMEVRAQAEKMRIRATLSTMHWKWALS